MMLDVCPWKDNVYYQTTRVQNFMFVVLNINCIIFRARTILCEEEYDEFVRISILKILDNMVYEKI